MKEYRSRINDIDTRWQWCVGWYLSGFLIRLFVSLLLFCYFLGVDDVRADAEGIIALSEMCRVVRCNVGFYHGESLVTKLLVRRGKTPGGARV